MTTTSRIMDNYHPNSCRGCVHYDAGCVHYDGEGYDRDTGYSQHPHCEAAAKLYDDGDCTEEVSLMFEAILFKLSDLNNCPLRKESLRRIAERKSAEETTNE